MTEKRTTLEIIAPSIEEAIEEGLEKLGLTEDDVEIEVLDEGAKGLFGLGSRQARVCLIVRNFDEPADIPGEYEEDPDSIETESIDEDRVLRITRETVSELLEKMQVTAEVIASYGEPDEDRKFTPINVDIQGQDLSILIGRKAETLDALQFITKLILGKELEQSVPITIDVEGFRKRRTRQIQQLAQRIAEQVSETHRSQALEPMPAAERRIVHIELRDHPAIYTESIGENHRRKVVIYPKD